MEWISIMLIVVQGNPESITVDFASKIRCEQTRESIERQAQDSATRPMVPTLRVMVSGCYKKED